MRPAKTRSLIIAPTVQRLSQSFTVGPAQRGCIAYDQIKASDRTGNGNQLLTYSPAPAGATSPGTPGQVAFDAAGYWYFCDGVNQWGRIGPTGYGRDNAARGLSEWRAIRTEQHGYRSPSRPIFPNPASLEPNSETSNDGPGGPNGLIRLDLVH